MEHAEENKRLVRAIFGCNSEDMPPLSERDELRIKFENDLKRLKRRTAKRSRIGVKPYFVADRFRCQECGSLVRKGGRRCGKCGSYDIDIA